MKVKDLYEELKEKSFFQEFQKKNSEAFLYAGFFVLDLENNSEKLQLDFFNPEENKIEIIEFPFKEIKTQENKIPGMEEPILNLKKIKSLNLDLKVDIDDLQEASKKIIKDNDAKMSPTKIIAVLKDDKWNLTCMDNMLSIIGIELDAKTGDQISFKKNSLMDIVKVKKS